MTATAACRIELEALRERLSTIIQELKHVERMFDAEGMAVTLAPGSASSAITSDRVPPTRSAAAIKDSTPTSRVSSPNDAKVVAALTAQGWMRIEEIATRTKLPKGTAYTRLTRLHGTGEVVTRSEGKRTLYRLAGTSTQLRPRAGAGTQAAPPVGPPSANGRQASSGFEVAWNGTKERNGEAPSILPPRERKP